MSNKPLHIRSRPKKLEDVIGNTHIVKCLEQIIKRKNRPRVYLLHGHYGCGKTSIAKIIASNVGCNRHNTIEINAGNEKGVETAREIIRMIKHNPLIGETRFIILDECHCFAKGTKIQTPSGEKAIETLLVGDNVYNIAGISQIINTFKNKVILNKVCKLKFNNGDVIYTTIDHLFLTDNGWIEAQNLKKEDLLLKFSCDIMLSTHLKNSSQGEKNEDMQILQKGFQEQAVVSKTKNLFKIVRSRIETFAINKSKILQILLQKNGSFGFLQETMLWNILCKKINLSQSKIQEEVFYAKEAYKCEQRIEEFLDEGFKKNAGTTIEKLRENEKEKSNIFSKSFRKNTINKNNEQHIAHLERKKRREWTVNDSARETSFSVRMGNRIPNFIRKTKKWISNLLQSRYCKSKIKNSDRGRWVEAYYTSRYKARLKKNKKDRRVRLEGIEIYKQGDNDKSFSGIIENKERNQGYVEFYDLEILNHPSYFANNYAVHNCLTSGFQQAILTTLEDSPSNTYFALCTTDPGKIIKTIRSRCLELEVKPLSGKEMKFLLNKIIKEQSLGKFISDNTTDKIIRNADGIPRNALLLLEKIIGLKDIKAIDEILSVDNEMEHQVIDLCRAIMFSKDWNKSRKIMKSILETHAGNLEQVRLAILGYVSSVALGDSKPNSKAILVYECFKDLFYGNDAKAKFIFACMYVLKSQN